MRSCEINQGTYFKYNLSVDVYNVLDENTALWFIKIILYLLE